MLENKGDAKLFALSILKMRWWFLKVEICNKFFNNYVTSVLTGGISSTNLQVDIRVYSRSDTDNAMFYERIG